VERIAIGVGVHRHGGDAKLAARPDHPNGDLTPVGDQDALLCHLHAPRAIIDALVGPVNKMGQDSLERAVQAAGINARPVWFDEVGSTNDEARRLALEGAPAWTVVATGHQTAGRGRLGRSWADVPGRSLLCSVILRRRLGPDEAGLVSLAAVVALIEAAGLLELGAKWPNDLVVGQRKCGGILAEAEVRGDTMRHVVLGAGVNVSAGREALPAEVRETATSLRAEGASIDLDSLLSGFLSLFRSQIESSGFPSGVVDAYRPRCRTLGRNVRAVTASGDAVEGRAVDVDDLGSLLVERDGRVERVAFGEVTYLE
jgi:BirA family biotin operon repressor/biotin-[acetyl-CoA-carboxylase] ligase